MRKVKREIAVGQAHGCDMAAKRAELGVAQRRLREHVSANKLVRDYSRERAYGVAEQPRALGAGKRGLSYTAFARSDAFKTAAKAAGVTQKQALAALRQAVGASGVAFEGMTPAQQLSALRRALKGSRLRKGATVEEARAFVRSPFQNVTVIKGKQNEHVRGTREWDARVARQGGEATQSEVTVSLAEIQALVDELRGTGIINVGQGDPPQLRERCTDHDGIIGWWVSENGERERTNSFTIHYRRTGVHIVPAMPSWRWER